MIKYILWLLILVLPVFVNADSHELTFNLRNSIEFDENEWEVYLPVVEIDLTDKKTNTISLFISNDWDFIFANNQLWVTTTNSKIKNISFDNLNKTLKIIFNENITWKINLEGIKIRTYDLEIRDWRIWLDYNDDNIVDKYSTNFVSLEENDRYSDNMYPLPVSDIKSTVTKNNNWNYDITINWKKSPDLDGVWSIVKVNKNNNYWNIIEKNISLWEEQTFKYLNMNLEKDVYKIKILSKDFYYETREPYVIILNKDYLTVNSKEETIKWKDNNTDKSNKTEETIKEEKYIPIFVNNQEYNLAILKLDHYIERKSKWKSNIKQINNIMKLRNLFLITLEKFDKVHKNEMNKYKLTLEKLLKLLKEELK